ncbi:MAG TPA: hypothetical protein VFA80_11640 [Xanthobacteraceae bacterium]|jgi:hypothetical protein|nr:hypothetical protein [Xanthobacteraceae bacterium]
MAGVRRRDCVILGALIAAWVFQPVVAGADQAFARFLPLLIDLDGWQGNKADGVSMEMPGNSMTSAKRDYKRGAAQLQVTVLMGQAATGALAPTKTPMNIETGEGHMITTTLNGFPVTKTYNNSQKSGALLVALGPSALLTVSYNGISEDDGLALARKFDWKAIQAATQK